MNGDAEERAPGSVARSLRADLWALWVSPASLFRSLRESPRSRLALALLLAVIAVSAFVTRDLLVETMRVRGAEEIRAKGGDPVVLDALDSPYARIGILLLGPVSLVGMLLAFSAAAYLILMITGGTEAERTFSQIFRVAVWSRLVEVPHMLLWVPLALAKGSVEIYFGPAALLAGDPRSPAFRVLAGFDLFAVWFLALFVLGTKITLGVSTRRAAAAVLVPWGVWQLLKVAGDLL